MSEITASRRSGQRDIRTLSAPPVSATFWLYDRVHCCKSTLIRQLEISAMTVSIGGKTALDWAMKQDFRCGFWLMEKPEIAMKAITGISIANSGVT